MRAASCAAATRSASLPTSPKRVTMPLLTRTWTRVICSLRSARIRFSISDTTRAFSSATRCASLPKVEWREFDFTTLFSDEPEFAARAGDWSDSTSGSTDFVGDDSVAIVLWNGVFSGTTSEDGDTPTGNGERG